MRVSELIATLPWVEETRYINDNDNVAVIAFTTPSGEAMNSVMFMANNGGKMVACAPLGRLHMLQATRTAVESGADEHAMNRALTAVYGDE